MNQNRPFCSTNTNFYDESFRSSTPTTYNGQNIILSQEQQRRICDTLNTSIVGNNFGLNTNIYPGNVLFSQKQLFPGGAVFTFTQQQPQPQCVTQGMCCKCPALHTGLIEQNNFHSGLNTFFPSSLENPLAFGAVQSNGQDHSNFQNQISRNHFQLKFHSNHGTSCSDLLNYFTQVPPSKGYPDISNITGAVQQNQVCSDPSKTLPNEPIFFPLPSIDFSSNAKKLVLSKKITSPCGHVVDILDEKEQNDVNKKKVSFSDENKENIIRDEKASQISADCICDAKKCKKKTKKSKKNEPHNYRDKENKEKKKNCKKTDGTSSETAPSSDSENQSDAEKPKKLRWGSKKHKTNESSADTQSSDVEDQSESKKSKRRKSKISKKDNGKNMLDDDPQNVSDSSYQQSSVSEHSASE